MSKTPFKRFVCFERISLTFIIDRDILVSTQELVNTIRQIQKVSNQSTDAQVWEIIHQFDHDKDGFIVADDILEVMSLS